ncbi:MAG: hypothetical protein AB7O57_01280 [Hyphomicrobiaceae bacterium]
MPSSVWLEALHDLRQPIQGALLLHAAAEAAPRLERQRAGRLLEATLAGLSEMVDCLAHVNRLEIGLAALAPAPCDLAHVLTATIASLAGVAGVTEAAIEIDEGLPHVVADPHVLDRLMLALLGTALAARPRSLRVGARRASGHVMLELIAERLCSRPVARAHTSWSFRQRPERDPSGFMRPASRWRDAWRQAPA